MPWLFRMTLLVSVLMVPAVLYLSFRLYYILRPFVSRKGWARNLPPLLLFSFYVFPLIGLIDFYASGDIEVLAYPKPLTYWFWFGLVFVFQLTTWVILADVIKLVTRFFSWDQNRISQIHSQVVIGFVVLVFSFTVFKVYSDTTKIKTDNITLVVDKLPNKLVGFKIVHISDIQGDEYTDRQRIERYIQKINEQNADLVVFTGDLISYGTDFIEMSAEEFGKIQSKYGTYAVVGDHDYWAGLEHVEPALIQHGIPLLQDENHVVDIDSSLHAVITAVTEIYSKDSDPAVVDSLTNISRDASIKIFASHQVKEHLITSARNNSYEIMLAGHTHGGQIHVPFMGMSFSASERETEYIQGFYDNEGLPINVNNGLGFTLAPIRYNAPPNISVITLEPEKNK